MKKSAGNQKVLKERATAEDQRKAREAKRSKVKAALDAVNTQIVELRTRARELVKEHDALL